MRALSRLRKQLVGAALLVGCAGVLFPRPVLAQDGLQFAEQVKTVQAQIAAEESRHAGADVLGYSWQALGKLYESQLHEQEAEDAYARALPLLRTAGPDAQYADSLHGMGAVCVSSGKFADCRKYLAASLAIYEKLQDGAHSAMLHQALATELVENGKFKDAIAEAWASLTELAAAKNAPPETLIAGYMLRSEAEYHSGENADALTDVARARAATVRAGVADNSLERIAISLAEGAALTRAGQLEQGHAAFEEALQLASTRTDLPRKLHLRLQIWILNEYSASLQAVHRKQDARQINVQVAKLRSQLPAECEGCTVGVAALRIPGLP
jgi:tetratricopeptide (TPR) repeat protein